MHSTGNNPNLDFLRTSALAKDYAFIEVLGSGGFGTVVKASQSSLSRIVAIKLVRALNTEDIALKRFIRESQILSSFSHTNVAKVFTSGQLSHNDAYMVMEFIEGISLDRLDSANLTPSKFKRIFEQCAEALKALHAHSVVHRDIKPSNYILTSNNDNDHVVKLVDFGLSKKLVTEETTGQQLTLPGHIVGTPTYMSPEQCLGRELDGRSDLYSLGCCMYQLLTGKPPFGANTPHEVMAMHLKEQPAPPASVRTELSNWTELAAIETILGKCLAKEPKDRYQTPNELISDLNSAEPPARTIHQASKKVDHRLMYTCIAIIVVVSVFAALNHYSRRHTTDQIVKSESSREIFRDIGIHSQVDKTFTSEETPKHRDELLNLTLKALEADSVDHELTPRQRYSLLGTKQLLYIRILLDPSISESQRKNAAQQIKLATLDSMALNDRKQLSDSVHSAHRYLALIRACEVAPPRLKVAEQLKDRLKTDHTHQDTLEFRDACMRLARLYIFANRPKEALSFMHELKSMFDSDSQRSSAYALEGIVYLYNDDYKAAIERLLHTRDNQTSWARNDESVQGLLFRAYLLSGNKSAAREVLEIIQSDSKPNNEAPQVEMLWSAKNGDWGGAKENFEKVKDTDITDEKYYYSMQDWDLRKLIAMAHQAKQTKLAEAAQAYADERAKAAEALESATANQ